jgi:hypothetical protein
MNKASRKKMEADILSALTALIEINNKQAAAKMKKHLKKQSKTLAKKFATVELKLSKKKPAARKKVK